MSWNFMERETINKIHRRLAILEGKPDPGLDCPNPDCRGGLVDVAEHPRDTEWEVCQTCNGERKIWPPLEK